MTWRERIRELVAAGVLIVSLGRARCRPVPRWPARTWCGLAPSVSQCICGLWRTGVEKWGIHDTWPTHQGIGETDLGH